MAHEWAKGLLASLLLVALVSTVLPIQAWREGTPPQESIPRISKSLFDTWVFPFELLSILLLGALLGALAMGQKVRREEREQP